MCEWLVLYQTVLSDTPEIRSLRLVLAEKQTLYRLDRGEASALSFNKECQSYHSIKNVKAYGCTCQLTSIMRPSLRQGIRYSPQVVLRVYLAIVDLTVRTGRSACPPSKQKLRNH
jgi:hypothetical protein